MDNVTKKGDRIAWVQALKAIGIYAIVLGHFSELAGDMFHVVFLFHIQLFFFASGFFAKKTLTLPFFSFLKTRGRSLLVPYVFFSAFNLLCYTLYEGNGLSDIVDKLIQCVMGVRNQIFCVNLWFLPCLFVITVLYYLLSKVFKNRFAILGVCFAISVVFRLWKEEPSWFFGLDSAGRFLFYYALGDFLFEPIHRFRLTSATRTQKISLVVITILCLGVLAAVYPGALYLPERLGLNLSIVAQKAYCFVVTLSLLYLSVLLSFVLQRFPALLRIGEQTLTICCTEQFMRVVVLLVLTMFGLELQLTNQIQTFLYAGLITALCTALGEFFTRYFPRLLGHRVK